MCWVFCGMGFVLLAVVVRVVFPGPGVLGDLGVALVVGLVIVGLGLGVCAEGPEEEGDGDIFDGERKVGRKVKDVGVWKVLVYGVVFVVMVGVLVALLVAGGRAVTKGEVGSLACGTDVGGSAVGGGDVTSFWTKDNPLPVDVVLGEAVTMDFTVMEGRITTITVLASGNGSESVVISTSEITTGAENGVATVVDLTTVTTSTSTTVLITA